MTAPIVDVRDLRKVYSGWSLGGRRRIDALQGVSLHADAGEVFGLLGPNGAGKTTLIKILLGVVKPSGGSAALFDEPLGSSAARRRVGYLPESLRVDRHHSARSALRYYGRMSGMSAGEISRRSDELLEMVGLRGRDRESVRRFSKGMYQRLGLAQALLHNPDLLVLDEPTDGLDPVGRSEVRRLIERLREAGKTIFLNSHILQEVEMVCSRVAILAKGQIRGIGRIDELSGGDQSNRVKLIVHAQSDDQNNDQPPTALKSIFESQGSESVSITSLSQQQWQIETPLKDQDQIDHMVDRVRQADMSISQLQIMRPSLEETFIRLVGQADIESSNDSSEVGDESGESIQ